MHIRLEKLLLKLGHFALVKLGVPTWRTEQTLKGLWYKLKLAVHDNIVIDRWKPIYFLYADESENKETNISSLTGIYFPEKKLLAIRTAMYAILRKVNDKLEKGPYEAAVELHGSALLSTKDYPNIDDGFRFQIYNQMVDIINKYKVLVFRLGYDNAKNIARQTKETSTKHYGLHSLNFNGILQHLTHKHKILMVMDSRNDDVVKNFSRMIHHQTSSMLMYPEKKLSFVMDKPYNVIDSVVYVDSEYSEIMQLADSVSYLLSKLDYKKQGKTLTQFGQRLAEIAERLDPSLVINSIVTMNLG